MATRRLNCGTVELKQVRGFHLGPGWATTGGHGVPPLQLRAPNISRAARELGLTRRGLYLKLERHDLSASA